MDELTNVLIDLYAMESASVLDLDDYVLEADTERAEETPASPEKKQNFLKKILGAIKRFFLKIASIFSKKLSAKLLMEKIDRMPESGIKFNKKVFIKALALQKKGYDECWKTIEKLHGAQLDTSIAEKIVDDFNSEKIDMDEFQDKVDKLDHSDFLKCSKKELKSYAATFAQLISKQITEIKKEEAKETAEAKKAAETDEKQKGFKGVLSKIWFVISFIPKHIASGISTFFSKCFKRGGNDEKGEEKAPAGESFLF